MLCVLQSKHYLCALWYELCAFSFYLCLYAGPELGPRLMRNGWVSLGKRLTLLQKAQAPTCSAVCDVLSLCTAFQLFDLLTSFLHAFTQFSSTA